MLRALLVVAAALAACAPPASPDIALHTAAQPLSGPCPRDGSSGSELNLEVQSLKLTVNAQTMTAPVTSSGDVGSLTLAAVPAGSERVVGVFGLAGSLTAWRGVTRHVEVKPNEDTKVDVLMARLADLTCARGADSDKRAFHTATVLADGRVLVVGGAKEGVDASGTCGNGCHQLTATASASIYDPGTGLFTPVAPLVNARMFHVAVCTKDGRVVVAGGTSRALVHFVGDVAHPFPIEPVDAIDSVEIFDPTSNAFTSGGNDSTGRVFAAATVTDDGDALITGGVPAPSPDLGNALDSTTLCGGSPFSCRAGPTMGARRAGHVAFHIDQSGVFLWGGSIDTDTTNGVGRFQIENQKGSGGFALLNLESMNPDRNLFFAASVQYVPFRMLIAGGLKREATGEFKLATATTGGAPLYIFDDTAGAQGGIATGRPPHPDAMALATPMFFGSAAPLSGDTRAIIAGGFTDLAFTPSNDLELFNQDTLTVTQLLVGGVARTMRDPRGGLVAATNDDGNVVLLGGEAPGAGGRGPLDTAEIFSDPQTPVGVAE